jgi:N-methylhydantoinase B/oxoprolinase/acetone carboxylase alpha subunit
LKPIDVRIPKNSFLSPSDKAAVVGGNVLTVSSFFIFIFNFFYVGSLDQNTRLHVSGSSLS